MGILDKVTSLLPWRRQTARPAGSDAAALRDDLDRWLQRLFEEPQGFHALDAAAGMPAPSIRETEDDMVLTVEVPGFDRDDLDLTITPEGLTIRGEKQEERGDEYVHGSFVRTVPLPPGLDVDRAEARVARGVLTVRFPKVAARPGTRRIPVRT
jgi:HSP20 family protein